MKKQEHDDTQQDHNKLRPFTFHGVHLQASNGSGQAVGDCPFTDCNVAGKFYINSKNGLWDCKVCNRSGNPQGFLEQLHAHYLEATKTQHYKLLEKARPGVSFQELQRQQLAFDGRRWYLPSLDDKGKLVNLHVWDGTDSKIMGTSGCSLQMILFQNLQENIGPIYVCEGHWDTYALSGIVTKLKEPIVVVGVPGSGVFKPEWLPYFSKREVCLLYDNDNAGQNGMIKAADMLKEVASSLLILRWPSNTPDKFDIRDLIAKSGPPKKGLKEIQRFLQVYSSSQETQIPRCKKPPFAFPTVIRCFQKHLHIDRSMEEALAVMFATVLSCQIPGDPLWLFIVGPPGAGKTAFLRSLEIVPDCFFQSSLTPHLLVSGFIPPGGEDPSLLARMNDRCLILKDYTEIKSMPQMAQEEIYGTLRGAYDGKVQRIFGNGVERTYECHFSMIAGVTQVIHGDTRATLGERFLKYEMIRAHHNVERHITIAISGMNKMAEAEQEIREVCLKFLHREVDLKRLPKIPAWVKDRIIALAQVIAFLRASVDRIYGNELKYRPEPEIGTRLAKQLVKLGQSLALIFNVDEVNPRCYELVERVAFDTSLGWNLDIIKVLMRNNPNLMIKNSIAEAANISESSMQKKLDDLLEVKVIERERLQTPTTVGHPPYGYHIVSKIAALWKRARIGEKPKALKKGKSR